MRHRKGGQQSKSGYMKNETQEEGQPPYHWGRNVNASCLGTDSKWRYNGGRGDMPKEERKRVKEERKVVTDTRRKKT